MSDELAQALMNVLDAVEAYDKEQPVQTRLSRKHYAMALAILKARESLAVWRDHRARMLDGERAPEYRIPVRIDPALGPDEWRLESTPAADYPKESVTL
jgi:hypothetical protein